MDKNSSYIRPEQLEFVPNRFSGQVVGIMGAGSTKNLGYAAAERLVKEGAYAVMLYDINLEGVVEASVNLEKIASCSKVSSFRMDVLNLQSVETVIHETVDECGRLDAIINCAGISGDTGNLIEESDPTKFRKIIDVNLFGGSYNLTKTVLPIMKQQRYGRILLVGSIAGIVVETGQELAEYMKANQEADVRINGIKILDGRLATRDEFAALALYIISPENIGSQGFMFDLNHGRRKR